MIELTQRSVGSDRESVPPEESRLTMIATVWVLMAIHLLSVLCMPKIVDAGYWRAGAVVYALSGIGALTLAML